MVHWLGIAGWSTGCPGPATKTSNMCPLQGIPLVVSCQTPLSVELLNQFLDSRYFSKTSLPKCPKTCFLMCPYKNWCLFTSPKTLVIKPWASPAMDRWGSALNEEMAKWTDEEISQCWASTQGVIRALHRGPVDRKRPGWKNTCVYTCLRGCVYIYIYRYRYIYIYIHIYTYTRVCVCAV